MIRSRVFAIALAATAILPAAAIAQSLPFRSGQWGAEFQSGDLTSAGVIRFFSPSSALVLDLGILDVTHDEEDVPSGGGTGTTVENSITLYNLRLGFRNYMPVATRVTGFWTVGGQFVHGSQTQEIPGPFGGRSEDSETDIGVFGQLGADYHVTNNLAVGVAYDLCFLHVSGESKDPGGTTDISGHRFTAGFTPVRVSLFF